MTAEITPILMPKWGLSMEEGKLAVWHVSEGTAITPGDEIMDVETDKIANVVEAADGGLLRRRVGEEGETYPVRALLGVMAPESVSDAEIDAYVEAYETPAAGEGDEEGAPADAFADLPQGRIRYAARPGPEDGSVTPVVLIHGFGGDLDNWLFNIDAVAEAAPVFALDLPGHGQSFKRAEAPDLALMVETLAAFLEYLELDKAHLVGHSMGGLVAGQLALDRPDLVAGLTLISSAGLGDEINADYLGGFVSAVGRRDLKPVLGDLFADKALVSRSMVDDLLKYKRLDGVQAFLEALTEAMFPDGAQSARIAAALAGADVPVRVIWGADDAVIPAAHAGAIGGADVHVIEGAGHMVQMEKAGAVSDLIKAAL